VIRRTAVAFKSDTFTVRVHGRDAEKTLERRRLLREVSNRHKPAMDRVVADASALAKDRQRALDGITDTALRDSAAR